MNTFLHETPKESQAGTAEQTLFPHDARQTTEWITILSAAGFDYRLSRSAGGWQVHVPSDRADAARREIRTVETINRGWPPAEFGTPRTATRAPFSWSPLGVSVFLAGLYTWLGPFDGARLLFRRAAADSERILAGEWWRTITALTVHSDADHLAGNLLCLLLVGHAVCRRVGSGICWLMILAGGVTGNACVALLMRENHVSVGASTACFAAIGFLVAPVSMEHLRRSQRWMSIWNRSWLPVAAGLALLGLTGTGPGSDLTAHAMGFFAGLLFGVPFGFVDAHPGTSRREQLWLQLFVLLTVLAAWQQVVP